MVGFLTILISRGPLSCRYHGDSLTSGVPQAAQYTICLILLYSRFGRKKAQFFFFFFFLEAASALTAAAAAREP